jgi:TetR/AcrR family transcriptional repressor of mexJK operon
MTPLSVRAGKDDRRKAILDVATDLFMQEGYAAASMSAIAARLGGSKGTLYNYFPSKELLFAALIKEACDAGDWTTFPPDGPDVDVETVLADTGLKFLNFLLGEKVRNIHRLVISESARFPELGRAFYDNGPRFGIVVMAAWLETQMAAGRLRAVDPERAAVTFLSLCKSEVHQKALWSVEPEPSDAAKAATVQTAVEVFMAAYGPKP